MVGETRQKLQALKQYSNYTIVDRIFGGHLVSTIVCEVCHNSSQNYEPFLDLSLPLIEERDHPPTSKQKQNHKKCKNNPEEESQRKTDNKSSNVDLNFSDKDEKKSKHQLKKEKEKNRKEKRKNKKGNRKDKLEFISAENHTIKDQNKKVEELLPTKLNENECIGKEEKTTLPQMKVIVESASDCKDEKDSNGAILTAIGLKPLSALSSIGNNNEETEKKVEEERKKTDTERKKNGKRKSATFPLK